MLIINKQMKYKVLSLKWDLFGVAFNHHLQMDFYSNVVQMLESSINRHNYQIAELRLFFSEPLNGEL